MIWDGVWSIRKERCSWAGRVYWGLLSVLGVAVVLEGAEVRVAGKRCCIMQIKAGVG